MFYEKCLTIKYAISGYAFWHEGDTYECSDQGVVNSTSETRSSKDNLDDQHEWICLLNGTSVDDMPCVDAGPTADDARELETLRQDEDRPVEEGEGTTDHTLLCNEMKGGDDREVAALDRYWRWCVRCRWVYNFCRWEWRYSYTYGRYVRVYQCYRRYRCYRRRCYGYCNCF